MKFYFDLHTHTIASNHAYSTLQENINAAKEAGLAAYGVSDHTGAMNVNGNIYFRNFKCLPRVFNDVMVLRGAEANIITYDGKIDLNERSCAYLDYVIASIHAGQGYESGTIEQNTQAYLNVMQNPNVKIIGHPDDGRFPFDMETVVKEAKRTGKLLELNNSSVIPGAARKNAAVYIPEMLRLCKQYETRIIVNSDAHFSAFVGRFENAERFLEEAQFPEELVANSSLEHLKWILSEKAQEELGL